ncbi:copper transporter [Nocardia brevicatena]|uniref:copper transporter n=1 Tax=Nocardia brevicatena TaxID=37327 RepID=UPI0002DFBBBD|nr:copper transporter [Nocardia brevicatena]
MISIRHHTVSLVAVFLALAVGVVLGSQTFAVDMLSGLRSDKADLQVRLDTTQERTAALTARLNSAEAFVTQAAGRILAGTLTDRGVLVFTTPDAVPADVDGVIAALRAAGADITGRIALTESFAAGAAGDRMRTALANVIPAGARVRTETVDQGSLAGDLLGLVLLLDPASRQPRSTPEELRLALETLRGGGFLGYGDAPVRPAQAAVVIGGGGTRTGGEAIARFAGALRERGSAVVVADRTGTAEADGPLAVIRADAALAAAVSTVDNLDRDIGRITTALALSEQLTGRTGRYGDGREATSLTLAAVPEPGVTSATAERPSG